MHEGEWRSGEHRIEREPVRLDDEESLGLSSEELEEYREADSREARRQIQELQRQIDHEEPSSAVVDLPLKHREPERLNAFQRAYQSLKQSKLARMLMVAAGLHVPLTPQGRAVMDRVVHGVETINPNWFKGGMVIHPQSEEKKAEVRAKIRERELRVDKKAVTEYEKKTSEQLAHGEHVSFKRMYFDLERLHGVPAEEVVEAERKADSMIEKYVNEVGGVLDKQKIKHITEEMYGPNKNYDWSQGTMTTYFRTGKRNCVSMDNAIRVVFEGVIERLPESERSKLELGLTVEKQHVIATLVDRRGSHPVTYFLEPGIRTLNDEEPEVGAARVNADFLKKSVVASEIVAISAMKGKLGEVLPSPDIDAITDQPIPRGFIVTGELKGAEFNYEQAQKDGLEPEPYEDTAKDPIQVELIEKDTTLEQANELFDQRLTMAGTHLTPLNIETSELHHPTAEEVRRLGLRMQEEGVPGVRVGGFQITSLDGWSQESVDALLRVPADSLEFNATSVQPVALERVLNSIVSSDNMPAQIVVLSGTEMSTQHGISFQHFRIEDFYKLLSKFDRKQRTIRIDYPTLDLWEWEALKRLEAQTIDLSHVQDFHAMIAGGKETVDANVDVTNMYAEDAQNAYVGKILRALQDSGKRIYVNGVFYMNQALRDDAVFDYKKIIPSFEDIERGQLGWFRSELMKRRHPYVKALIEGIDYEIGRQNALDGMVKH